MQKKLENYLKALTEVEEVKLSKPPKAELGDFAFGVFPLAKVYKKNPNQIAEELLEKINNDKPEFIEKIEQAGPYLNFFLSKNAYSDLFKNLLTEKIKNEENKNRTIIVDYIGANVGKPLHIGHMCTPNLGQAIINVYRKLGYNVISDSHIGDWGIIFGKLIVAYKKWGSEAELKENAVEHLFQLYVKATKEEEENPGLNDEFQEAFKKLASGEKDYVDLWALFTKESIKAMNKQLSKLNVKPDYNIGESFYEGLNLPKLEDYPDLIWSMKDIVKELIEKQIAIKNEDNSVGVVFPEESKIPSCILQKRNGTHGYLASDLAAVKYRVYNWKPEKIIYFVDLRQSLHLQQVFKISRMAGRLKDDIKKMVQEDDSRKYQEDEKTKEVIGIAYKLQNKLGGSLQEKVYQQALFKILKEKGYKVEKEVKIPLLVDGIEVGYGKADLLVNDEIIIELKSTPNISQVYKQTRKYLSEKHKIGLVLNFWGDKVDVHRLEYGYKVSSGKSSEHHTKSSEFSGYYTELIHAGNGFVKLKDGAMSTRKGKIIKLQALLDEATQRAKKIILDKKLQKGEINEEEYKLISSDNFLDKSSEISLLAEIIGVGAIKYEYLRKNRELDIVFDWDQFMTFEGNSAPYIMYSYVRGLGILKKSEEVQKKSEEAQKKSEENKNYIFETNEEQELIKKLSEYKSILEETAGKYYPHILANYIYELTKLFNNFYNNVQVLNEEDKNKKQSRLALIKKTTDIIKDGFDLLGIKLPEKM